MKERIAQFNRYKYIIWYRTLADLKSESNRTYLGFIWFLLEPLLNTAVLYFVFSILMGRKEPDFVPSLLVGMTLWQWTEGSIMSGMTAITAKVHIHNMIALPKYLFPIVNITTNTVKFLFVFVIILGLSNTLGFYINFNYVYLPVLLLVNIVLILGITLPLTILSSYIADTDAVIRTIMRLLFFLSGIFFRPEFVPENLINVFYINPMACMMTSFRSVVVYSTSPDWSLVLYASMFGTVCTIIGLSVCKYVDKKILKYIH